MTDQTDTSQAETSEAEIRPMVSFEGLMHRVDSGTNQVPYDYGSYAVGGRILISSDTAIARAGMIFRSSKALLGGQILSKFMAEATRFPKEAYDAVFNGQDLSTIPDVKTEDQEAFLMAASVMLHVSADLTALNERLLRRLDNATTQLPKRLEAAATGSSEADRYLATIPLTRTVDYSDQEASFTATYQIRDINTLLQPRGGEFNLLCGLELLYALPNSTVVPEHFRDTASRMKIYLVDLGEISKLKGEDVADVLRTVKALIDWRNQLTDEVSVKAIKDTVAKQLAEAEAHGYQLYKADVTPEAPVASTGASDIQASPSEADTAQGA